MNFKPFGFTIIEILISIFVLAIITTSAVSNFRAGEHKNQLNLAANVLMSDIRKVQNMVMNGAAWDSQTIPVGGYGINFFQNGYVIFADENGNKKYDSGENIKSVSPVNISIDVDQYDGKDLSDIVFTPPKARACLNDSTCAPCDCNIKNGGVFNIFFTHDKTGDQVSASINQISGRVGIE